MGGRDEIPADDPYRRPDGADDADIEAAGVLSEAVEWVERARGRLYDFHQMIGRADKLVGEAADALDKAGHTEHAERLRADIVGRNVLDGRWTFQIVDEFDDLYWSAVRQAEQRVRQDVAGGRRHVYESEMKEHRRTRGHPAHTARPDSTG